MVKYPTSSKSRLGGHWWFLIGVLEEMTSYPSWFGRDIERAWKLGHPPSLIVAIWGSPHLEMTHIWMKRRCLCMVRKISWKFVEDQAWFDREKVCAWVGVGVGSGLRLFVLFSLRFGLSQSTMTIWCSFVMVHMNIYIMHVCIFKKLSHSHWHFHNVHTNRPDLCYSWFYCFHIPNNFFKLNLHFLFIYIKVCLGWSKLPSNSMNHILTGWLTHCLTHS